MKPDPYHTRAVANTPHHPRRGEPYQRPTRGNACRSSVPPPRVRQVTGDAPAS
ncbi:MAG: hypothetical protein AVDCRST_MAG64-4380 [uncultured Phycisphaerae bacterium]|uniref:Uncharacterized protein n=1 Tax=uncultured Phycisphaerae bacterium TaxID=904963 RepID=A0A6J4QG04_9BACT|nr:MAG: hypothetical protein AVDCRST_MAG64-4380 [uncultured Phycisphaerae bacterium]